MAALVRGKTAVAIVVAGALVAGAIVYAATARDGDEPPVSGPTTTIEAGADTAARGVDAPADPAPVTVPDGRDIVVDLGGGATLLVPAGSVRPGATVTASYGDPPDLGGEQPLSAPVELATDPEGALTGPVTFRFPIADDGRTAVVKTFDPVVGGWVPVPTEIDPAAGVVTATVTHFSWWGSFLDTIGEILTELGNRFVQNLGEVLGWRADPAPCPRGTAVPNWVFDVSVTNDGNAPLRGCAESEGDTLVVELVNNRPYGVVLRYGAPVLWGWSDKGASMRDIGANAIAGGAASLFGDGLYVPALSRAAIGIDRDAIGTAPASFTAVPNGLTIGLDALFTIIDNVGVQADRSGLVNALATALSSDCVRLLMGTTFDLSDAGIGGVVAALSDLVPATVRCAMPVLTEALLSQIGGISREMAGRIFQVLDQVNVVGQVVERGRAANALLELLRDGWLGTWGGFNVSVLAVAAPDTTSTTAPPTTAPPTTAPPTTPTAPPGTPPPTPPQTRQGTVNGCNTYGQNCDGNPIYESVPPPGYNWQTFPKITTVPNGSVLTARCWAQGGVTTNYATWDPGPNPYDSDIYFSVQAADGRWGFIPDTYFVRDETNKLGLPHC